MQTNCTTLQIVIKVKSTQLHVGNTGNTNKCCTMPINKLKPYTAQINPKIIDRTILFTITHSLFCVKMSHTTDTFDCMLCIRQVGGVAVLYSKYF